MDIVTLRITFKLQYILILAKLDRLSSLFDMDKMYSPPTSSQPEKGLPPHFARLKQNLGKILEYLIFPYTKSLKIQKGTIRIRKSKKDRQHNGQKKKDKRTNNDLQNIHTKLKIE